MLIKRWLLFFSVLLSFGIVKSSDWIVEENHEVTRRYQHGIKNDGYTCYVASLVQLLFNVFHFRDAVLNHDGGDNNEILLALQIVFSRMLLNKGTIGITLSMV